MTKIHALTYQLLGLSLLFLGSASTTSAASIDDLYKRIKRHYSQSLRFTIAKRYPKALQEAQQGLDTVAIALRSQPSPQTKQRLLNTRSVFFYIRGRIHQLSRQWYKACLSYRKCLQQPHNADVRRKADVGLKEIRKQAGVQLTIKSLPTNADVELNSPCLATQLKGTTPWRQKLIPGTYQLRMSAKNHRSIRQTIQLNANANSFYSLPAAKRTPTAIKTRRTPQPTPQTTNSRIPGYIVLGVGIAGLATAVTILGISIADQVTYEEIRGNPGEDKRALEVAERGTALRTSSFVIGGISIASIVAGAVLLAFTKPASPPPPPKAAANGLFPVTSSPTPARNLSP